MKKTTKLLKCSNPECRKRFPVNLEKHTNRKERTCPFCRTTIQIRRSLRNWKPNPQWSEQKEDARDRKRTEKEMKRRPKKPPSFLKRFLGA